MQLHHFAFNIRPNTLAFVILLFEQLGCAVSYREAGARWCMIQQKSIPVDIQIIETEQKSPLIDEKKNTHIAFLSNNPEGDLDKIVSWVKTKGYGIQKGSWEKTQLWFDLPDVFVNFVIEIMHTSVVE